MTDRTQQLLGIPVPRLFRAGGCHIFVSCLVKLYRYPILSIKEIEGDHCHLACAPAPEIVLDAYGWFSRPAYVKNDYLEGRPLTYSIISWDSVVSRFTYGDGRGFYFHQSFVNAATELAENWISKYSCYFDGTLREAIPHIHETEA